MRFFIYVALLLNSCVTTEYHASSPLSKDRSLDIKTLNSFDIKYDCPNENDKLLCTYAGMFFKDKGYIKDQPEGSVQRPNLDIKLTSTKLKDYGSGAFDFVLWIITITTWPYESQKFFKVDITISTEDRVQLKDSFYSHYGNNYSWAYTLTKWIGKKFSKKDHPTMEEAGSLDLYRFLEASVESSLGIIESGGR